MLSINVQAQDNITPYFVATMYGDQPTRRCAQYVISSCVELGLQPYLKEEEGEFNLLNSTTIVWFRVEQNNGAYKEMEQKFLKHAELQRAYPSLFAYMATEIAVTMMLN